jgi:hypothetical protein
MFSVVFHGSAPPYLADHVRLTSSIGRRSGLRFANTLSSTFQELFATRRQSFQRLRPTHLEQSATACSLSPVDADFYKTLKNSPISARISVNVFICSFSLYFVRRPCSIFCVHRLISSLLHYNIPAVNCWWPNLCNICSCWY